MLIQSLSVLGNSLRVPDLRKKIFFTLALIVIYRIGCFIPVPFIDTVELSRFMEGQLAGGGGVFGLVNLFTGGAFAQMTIFALGIMPYISAQIILQLLVVVSPTLEKLSKEGEIGRRRMNKYTRYGTIGLTAFQAIGLGFYLRNPAEGIYLGLSEIPSWLFIFTTVVAMTTGTAFLMWLGERITDNGIGNGISLLITLSIISIYPSQLKTAVDVFSVSGEQRFWIPIAIFLLLFVTWGIIMIQEGARRIPIQHARRVVGRRVMGGQGNVLPLKVNTAGVIPVIFSSAIMSLPSLLFAGLGGGGDYDSFMGRASIFFQEFFALQSPYSLHMIIEPINNGLSFIGIPITIPDGGVFNLLKSFNAWMLMFVLLTGFFCFLYTSITFNPLDVADNLKKSGAFIPGYRPGKPTAEYIDFVLTRITVIGATFLVGVAAFPYVLLISFGMPPFLQEFVGGTGLIIVVGVVLQTVQQLEAQLVTHNYEGLRTRRRRRGEIGAGEETRRGAERRGSRRSNRGGTDPASA